MKYMGSKRTMLSNHLGQILPTEIQNAGRFADLFIGSAAVSWYVAENTSVEVIGADLQDFAVILANAVISRRKVIDGDRLWRQWSRRARQYYYRMTSRREADALEVTDWLRRPKTTVKDARRICRNIPHYTITQSYGGYYFSPKQALQLDALRATLPSGEKSQNL